MQNYGVVGPHVYVPWLTVSAHVFVATCPLLTPAHTLVANVDILHGSSHSSLIAVNRYTDWPPRNTASLDYVYIDGDIGTCVR